MANIRTKYFSALIFFGKNHKNNRSNSIIKRLPNSSIFGDYKLWVEFNLYFYRLNIAIF